MNIVVYTANVGSYDEFNHPKVMDSNVRYLLFTDNKYVSSPVWEICHLDFIKDEFDDRKYARYLKINPHIVLPKHDISIWIDHNLSPKINNFSDFLREINFDNNDIMAYKHRVRNCIYSESNKVLELRKERPDIVKLQMDRYRNENFPKNFGLFETGILVRRNNKKMELFNNFWWKEILNGSGRDQLSQMYTSWKTNTKITPIINGKSQYENNFITHYKHNKELKF